VDTLCRKLGQSLADLSSRTGETLVRISTPVGEVDPISAIEVAQALVQVAEICGSVNQRLDLIALGPGSPITTSPIDLGRGIAPLVGRKEPTLASGHRNRSLLREHPHACRNAAGPRVVDLDVDSFLDGLHAFRLMAPEDLIFADQPDAEQRKPAESNLRYSQPRKVGPGDCAHRHQVLRLSVEI
jgi:hypothetical protein